MKSGQPRSKASAATRLRPSEAPAVKRSAINKARREALACFAANGWALPPRPKWDVTDFGLGDFNRNGLTLVSLAEEAEYCEKLMYARRGQETPCHAHRRKKEDIICRAGELTLNLWPARPSPGAPLPVSFEARINGERVEVRTGAALVLAAGSRITLERGVWHSFRPSSEECVIGEVSTANDDLGDNFFLDPAVGRFPGIEEDEPARERG
jgi:D-lyxose ketol-isomerase